jgi:transglutaminase-like putative cysteine protease
VEFEITHITDYAYQYAAAEAYLEARLSPPDTPQQTVRSCRLVVEPNVKLSGYTDYYGNAVEFFSLPYRHRSLVITSRVEVQTHQPEQPLAALEVSIDEARQILHSSQADVFDYLQPTEIVVSSRDSAQWARRYLRGDRSLGEALPQLNQAVYEQFAYASGSTTNSTPLAVIWQQRKGVCQDFTHIMLSVLRTAGLPARYVCGYIEALAPPSAAANNTLGRAGRTLVGAVATHAWVEVLVPGRRWVALDPTNKQWCGERHITVSHGRDFRDATPVRGTFKGTGKQNMKVKVFVKRRPQPAVNVENGSAANKAAAATAS